MPKIAALGFATLALDLLISSAAIGVGFFAALRYFRIRPSPKVAILGLLGLFALLDLIWWPVAALSTATFTIHDPELASFFDLRPETPVSSFLGVGLMDLLFWFLQTGVAIWVAKKLVPGLVEGAA